MVKQPINIQNQNLENHLTDLREMVRNLDVDDNIKLFMNKVYVILTKLHKLEVSYGSTVETDNI